MAVFLSGQLRPSKSKQAIIFRMFFVFISLSTLVSISSAAPAATQSGLGTTELPTTENSGLETSISVENHLLRRSTENSTRVNVCLPVTSTELIQKLRNTNEIYSHLQIIPLALSGSVFTVGVLDGTIDLLNNKELSECVTTYALKELPNRFPRYVLVTECDLSCNNDTEKYKQLENKELKNQFNDLAIGVNTLHLEDDCDEGTGREICGYNVDDDVVFISQCTLFEN